VNAVDGAGLNAQVAEDAPRVVDRELAERAALGSRVEPGAFVDRRTRAFDLDAVDRTGARALVAHDADVGLEVVDASVPLGDLVRLVRVLNRNDLFGLDQILQRQAHARRDGLGVVPDVAPVAHDSSRPRLQKAASAKRLSL
jgi:hypothetical protein